MQKYTFVCKSVNGKGQHTSKILIVQEGTAEDQQCTLRIITYVYGKSSHLTFDIVLFHLKCIP